jgi:hypothetical protein
MKRRYVKDVQLITTNLRVSSRQGTSESSLPSLRRVTNCRTIRVAGVFLRSLLHTSSIQRAILVLYLLSTSVYGQQTKAPAAGTIATIAPTPASSRSNATVATLKPTLLVNSNATGTPVPPPAVPATMTPSTPIPSQGPTSSADPTTSLRPTSGPTTTLRPTVHPSDIPSSFPTSDVVSNAKGFYRQDFLMDSEVEAFFNDTETETLAGIFESFTVDLVPNLSTSSEIDTTCAIEDQSGYLDSLNRTINTVDYSCGYISMVENVTSFADRFLAYVNDNLSKLTSDMQDAALPVNSSYPAEMRQVLSPAPSSSPQPSFAPSLEPTFSSPPSLMPSPSPTITPTKIPLPTSPPNFVPLPSVAPITTAPSSRDRRLSVGAIAAMVIFTGIAVLAGLFFYYQSWRKKREQNIRPPFRDSSLGGSSRRNPLRGANRPPGIWTTVGSAAADNGDDGDETDRNVVISPTDSLLSNKSLLSAGESWRGDESGDEVDGTNNLQDEFDQYKDQNLEQLRADVEGNLSGFEGIMSAAVTNALMGDEETNVEMQELLWGCNPNPDGTEIEASALFEVSDWLKRNESAEGERKRAFMQEILNKMVTSVRFGVIVAEDASRTIHESAAILGLQLAEELPVTTVIISGMRKTTTAEDMIKALHEFGDIDVAAVASGRRGFGIVRFRRRKSVDRALRRYKSGEIVILDVSIQMKVLTPSGAVESR